MSHAEKIWNPPAEMRDGEKTLNVQVGQGVPKTYVKAGEDKVGNRVKHLEDGVWKSGYLEFFMEVRNIGECVSIRMDDGCRWQGALDVASDEFYFETEPNPRKNKQNE